MISGIFWDRLDGSEYLLRRDMLPNPPSSNAQYFVPFEVLSINEGTTLNDMLR